MKKYKIFLSSLLILAALSTLMGCSQSAKEQAASSQSTAQASAQQAVETKAEAQVTSSTKAQAVESAEVSQPAETSDTAKAAESTAAAGKSDETKAKQEESPKSQPASIKLNYSLNALKELTNLSFTVESYYDGTGNFEEYQVIRTKNKIKIKINGDPDVLGTVQYLVPSVKEDGNTYSHLKFYYSRPGADTGYDGSDLKDPYEIWKKKDATKLLNSDKLKKIGSDSIDGNPVDIYEIAEADKTYKIYYNEKYKVWLSYEVYINDTLDEKWTIKNFTVGKVTDEDADFLTKLPGQPDKEGYALINISEMISKK